MARIPTPEEHRRQFGTLTVSERRAVVRAVNRGIAVEKRKHAPLAVVVARRQMRLWRRAWVVGALIGLVAWGDGWQAVVVNGVLGMAMIGLMARYWFTRARRAEAANVALADGKRRGRTPPTKGAATVSPPAGRWLPRRRARE